MAYPVQTLNIPEPLHYALKQLAVSQRQTVKNLSIEALTDLLKKYGASADFVPEEPRRAVPVMTGERANTFKDDAKFAAKRGELLSFFNNEGSPTPVVMLERNHGGKFFYEALEALQTEGRVAARELPWNDEPTRQYWTPENFAKKDAEYAAQAKLRAGAVKVPAKRSKR